MLPYGNSGIVANRTDVKKIYKGAKIKKEKIGIPVKKEDKEHYYTDGYVNVIKL